MATRLRGLRATVLSVLPLLVLGCASNAPDDPDMSRPFASVGPTVSGNMISWADDGWYQVQRSADHLTVCEGGRSCVVENGTYDIINHTTSTRWDDVGVPSPTITLSVPPRVDGNTISWGDDGWYQVQRSADHLTVCEGGLSCTVDDGTYDVINHTNEMRWDDIVVGTPAPPSSAPTVEGNTISWADDGWYQVQRASDHLTVCEGGRSCVVEDGTYDVINHSTEMRWDDIVVGDVASPREGDPVIASGEAARLRYSRVFSDEFDGATVSASNWKFIDMSDGLHRAGNAGIDADGRLTDNSVSGKRWSAWYNAHQDTVTRIEDGHLVMGGLFTDEPDPTRVAYNDNGLETRFDDHKMYTSFLSTWDRVWSNEVGGHITDPDGPDRTWGPGHFFEMKVSFEEMNTQGFRLSWYLLPAYENASASYDESVTNGIENDLFEYDPSPGGENVLQIKVISGDAAGNTPGGSVDLSGFDIDIARGFHTIGLLWTTDEFAWFVDGQRVLRDTERVPQVPHYMVISREMNSGAKLRDIREGDLVANPPYVPEDVGIWATNVWRDRANINSDVGRIDYVRVWSVDGS